METLLLGLGGNIWNQNRIADKIEVKGKVDGRIVNRNGESNIGGSIIGGTVTQDITNEGMIGQKIEVTQNSTIQNGIIIK
ncbi:hypothetical protein CUPS3785_04375 [Campylobacter upsaliensis]|uniref:hypothetical protein n=1 Tax=Campylobacter upsaliensis TaxID=28080 RepID=UPI00214A7C96|nr:hypothetical protein [Campylobacter upsaliensis]MCR2122307.1 hypothetical protein [Campylobacter upsaliensis]